MSQFQRDRGRVCPSSTFLFCVILHGLDNAHPHWWGWIFITQSIDSNANWFQKSPQRDTPRNNVLSAIWAPPSSVKWAHEITIIDTVSNITTTTRQGIVVAIVWMWFECILQRFICGKLYPGVIYVEVVETVGTKDLWKVEKSLVCLIPKKINVVLQDPS
jgi:hypothetical protein